MVITSGDITLDKLLGGGFQKDLVYLLCGNQNNTSNILLKTSVTSQKPILKEGLGEGIKIAFVDGNNRFNPYDVSKFAVSLHLSPRTVLDNILIARAFTWDQMIELLENKISTLEQVRVVLISGITTFLKSYERQTFEDLLRAVDKIKNIFERTKPLIIITAPLNEDFLFSPIEGKDLSHLGKVLVMINDDEQYVKYTLIQNLLLKWKPETGLLNPQKIYENYKNRRLSKFETVKKLIMIIEREDNSLHVESSVKLLKELIINEYLPGFFFVLYDLMGWSESPMFDSVKKELLKKMDSYIQEYVNEGVIYEEAILLAFFEQYSEKLVKVNFNEDINDVWKDYLMHYKVSEDGYVIGLYISPHGDPGYIPFIPENLYRLQHLEEFVISRYELKTIPESIGKLKSLRVLNLDYNLIVNLPQSIGDLDALEELSLIGNYIEVLPESINSLKSLKKLDISENDTEYCR